jgi:hypothetical protein
MAVEKMNKTYTNIGQRVAKSREVERGRDKDRRAKAEAQRQEADRSDTKPEEQPALVSGAGTEWSAGQADYSHGASWMYAYPPEMRIDGLPQEYELDADRTTY